jgi:hypothetical protein
MLWALLAMPVASKVAGLGQRARSQKKFEKDTEWLSKSLILGKKLEGHEIGNQAEDQLIEQQVPGLGIVRLYSSEWTVVSQEWGSRTSMRLLAVGYARARS